MINAGLFPVTQKLINHAKKQVRKEVCWSLSNVTAGSKDLIQQVINAGLIDELIERVKTDDPLVQNEAVWALANTSQNASPEQATSLVGKDIINALCSVLDSSSQSQLLMVAMTGLANMLKFGQDYFCDEKGENLFATEVEMCGGVDKLEEL